MGEYFLKVFTEIHKVTPTVKGIWVKLRIAALDFVKVSSARLCHDKLTGNRDSNRKHDLSRKASLAIFVSYL